jgi:hypothetical protein
MHPGQGVLGGQEHSEGRVEQQEHRNEQPPHAKSPEFRGPALRVTESSVLLANTRVASRSVGI